MAGNFALNIMVMPKVNNIWQLKTARCGRHLFRSNRTLWLMLKDIVRWRYGLSFLTTVIAVVSTVCIVPE
jgi:hypothetical protein